MLSEEDRSSPTSFLRSFLSRLLAIKEKEMNTYRQHILCFYTTM